MLTIWAYVEADFMRDYNINLAEELPNMSWRRFKTLMNGLSPWGAVATHYDEALKKQKEQEARKSNTLTQAQEGFWAAVASI